MPDVEETAEAEDDAINAVAMTVTASSVSEDGL